MAHGKRLTTISLFSGAGGLDFGFESAGFRTAACVEWDGDACDTLRANRRWPVLEGDIHELSTREILKEAGLKKRELDVLIGGPPCQPFSKSVSWWRTPPGVEDPRAGTLGEYLRVVEDALPRAFLLENVAGFFSKKGDGALEFVNEQLSTINRRTGTKYTASWRVLNCADFGVPQLRERFFLVAERDGALFEFPSPSFRPRDTAPKAGDESKAPHRTAWDAIGHLATPDAARLGVRGKFAWVVPSIPEGWNYLWHTERGQSGLRLWGYRTRYWNFLLKLAKSLPAWTVQASPGPSVGPFHWSNRRLSIEELCALQTFPPGIRIVGGRTSAQRQVGNAVPSLMAETLALEIRRQFFGRPRRETALLPEDRAATCPAPEETHQIDPNDERVKALIAEHAPHPGAGFGPGAESRRQRSKVSPAA